MCEHNTNRLLLRNTSASRGDEQHLEVLSAGDNLVVLMLGEA